MRNDGKAELQHYVPQLLLRLHVNNPSARRGTEQVWCFDKLTDNVSSPNVAGILAGTRFYEVEIDGEVVSLEESVTKIEDAVSPVLTRIVATQTGDRGHLRRRFIFGGATQSGAGRAHGAGREPRQRFVAGAEARAKDGRYWRGDRVMWRVGCAEIHQRFAVRYFAR
jgi:hypothetical protein